MTAIIVAGLLVVGLVVVLLVGLSLIAGSRADDATGADDPRRGSSDPNRDVVCVSPDGHVTLWPLA
jgi:hypothetical protein